MRTLLLLAGLTGLAVAQPPKDPPSGGNPVAGKWEVLEVLRGDAPDQDLKGAIREFKADGTYTLTPAAARSTKPVTGKYALDATKTPPQLDMTPDSGRYQGRTLKGVYKLDGDTLIVTFSEPDMPRPEDTESKPNRTRNVHKKLK